MMDWNVISVTPTAPLRLTVRFADGTEGGVRI